MANIKNNKTMKQPNPLLVCQPIQLPTFETCVKLKDLGVLPPTNGKQNAYLKHLSNGKWYLSDEKWNILSIKANDPNIEILFAPDLGQLRNLINATISLDPLLTKYILDGYCEYKMAYLKNGAWAYSPIFADPNEAQSMAELLIWLIEQGLIND